MEEKKLNNLNVDYYQFSRENIRRDTFENASFFLLNADDDVKNKLAKAGFYFTGIKQIVKCFSCPFKFNLGDYGGGTTNFVCYHKEKSPECNFIKLFDSGSDNARPSKKFFSYRSLFYEKERLETFIEWPVPFLNPEELAADGFYFLRKRDHCACVFCRGIIGAWEVGDTSRGEHRRHFPHCPFINGQAVGNIPMKCSYILDKLPLDGEECPLPRPKEEDCGGGGGENEDVVDINNILSNERDEEIMAGGGVNLDEIIIGGGGGSLRRYSGPKRRDYVTRESRIWSFNRWPDRMVQMPEDMANAGFFSCGLSDHVSCFHCGNGLRNWEIEDKPWEEHARWYPDCNFVVLFKGQEFIDKIRREKPLYTRKVLSKDGKKIETVNISSSSSGRFNPISDIDLQKLMELDIIKDVINKGYALDKIRKALKQKLEQTGMPFFDVYSCIDSVLKISNEEEEANNNNESQREEGGSSSSSSFTTTQEEAATRNRQHENMTEYYNNNNNNNNNNDRSGIVSWPIDTLITNTVEELPSSFVVFPIIIREEELLSPPPPLDEENVSHEKEEEEKKEMIAMAKELERIKESRSCKICMDAEIEIVFLPCGHMVTCSNCAVTMASCPICRNDIKYTVKPIIL